MRPAGTSEQLEKRRRRAVQLVKTGGALSAVARQVHASVSSVFRWWQAYRRHGHRGLRARPTPGRPPRLSEAQKRKLVRLLLQGALRAGYTTELWTLGRVAELIHGEFDVRYHPAHVWKVLTGLGWSCQKPERRAVERNEAAIARWKREEWRRIKNAARRGAHLVFVDESGFLLIPNVRRTWAPKGQTPCVRHRYRHDRLSICSGLAVSPKRRRLALYLRCRPRNLTGLDIHTFLRHLLRHLRGPVVLLWDRGSIQRRREVRAFLAAHPRLRGHFFPAYAPELNPAEYVWAQADMALANGAPDDLTELRHHLGSAIRRVRRSQSLLWSCIYASDLPWAR